MTILKPRDDKCLMIVDDDPAIRKLFATIVSSRMPGIVVELAGNGSDAVELFKKTHPHIIVMDLSMPGMDGLSAFRAISAHCLENDWQVPSVLFCTGFSPSATMDNVTRDGMHGLLRKPFTGDELVKGIQRLHEKGCTTPGDAAASPPA